MRCVCTYGILPGKVGDMLEVKDISGNVIAYTQTTIFKDGSSSFTVYDLKLKLISFMMRCSGGVEGCGGGNPLH
jgi:hypothetical protein